MEGMLKIRLRPWVRRMFTRVLAIVPAAVVAGVYGAAGAGRLLVLSQVGSEQMTKASMVCLLDTPLRCHTHSLEIRFRRLLPYLGVPKVCV